MRGRIVSDWEIEHGRLDLKVTIPVNTTATVYVPAADPARVKEGGKLATEVDGVKLMQVKEGCALFEVGSGTYHFTAPQ